MTWITAVLPILKTFQVNILTTAIDTEHSLLIAYNISKENDKHNDESN